MSELLDLAERCEKLVESNRDLDGLLYQSIDPVIKQCWPHWNWEQKAAIVPRYTESIDAAASLVPKGFQWKCGYSRHVPHTAEVIDYANHTGRYDGNSDINRALAICAAALRARASAAVGNAQETNR